MQWIAERLSSRAHKSRCIGPHDDDVEMLRQSMEQAARGEFLSDEEADELLKSMGVATPIRRRP